MPDHPYTFPWALDEPMSPNPAANGPPTGAHQPSQILSSLDIARLETSFKTLLDAREERLKNSIHKRVQTLMDKVQESHSKVIEAAEAVLKDRKKDRTEQARMSMIPPPHQLIQAPSKEQWDTLMDDIQRIHERLNELTERFADVADEPPDGNLPDVTEIPPGNEQFIRDAGADADPHVRVDAGLDAVDSDVGVDGDVDAGLDADVNAEGDLEYTRDGVFKLYVSLHGEVNFTSGVVGQLTILDDITLTIEPSPQPPHSQLIDPSTMGSEATLPAPQFQDMATDVNRYQLPGQQCYPSPVSQARGDSREMSMSQEPTPQLGQGYSLQAIGGGAYSHAFNCGESSVQTVCPQDIEPFPRPMSTSSSSSLSSLTSLSSLSTISPQKVTGKRRRSPSKIPIIGAKRNRAISLKPSNISWPELIPRRPGMPSQV